jgi:tRNA threonylcarbamoyladenosine biosynthesis protein TsaB
MALILNIDTATEFASIALCNDGNILATARNEDVRDHASWLQQAIQQLFHESQVPLDRLEAVAVTAGPGSYTGLRVGLASAKGLCFALGIPLITENTLKVMTKALIDDAKVPRDLVPGSMDKPQDELLLVPMIDARRLEVFTAVYDWKLAERMPPLALVLNAESYSGFNKAARFICFGSGSAKFQSIAAPGKFTFVDSRHDATALASLSYEKFINRQFSDLAYTEPIYLKDFYSPPKK